MSNYGFTNIKIDSSHQKNEPSFKHLNQPENRQIYQMNLQHFFNHHVQSQKINSMPLQFQYIPVQILSKEFTKLNSQHSYRIHYLGPRFINTLQMHKKYAFSEKQPFVFEKKNNVFEQKTQKQQPLSTDTNANEQQNHTNWGKKDENKTASLNSQSILTTPLYSDLKRYKIDQKKIVQSFFMSERLKSNHFYKSNIYYRAFEGMNPSLNLKEQFIFDSAFQSGNLDCVIKVKSQAQIYTQFDLFLKIDSNTRGHTQWFFFSVKNGNRKQKIRMNICNLTKAKTLYEFGMKPFVYSEKKYLKNGKQWIQDGVNICVQRKDLRYDFLYDRMAVPTLFCLTIQYDFQYENDEVFFAYCIPFTYSEMLQKIEELPKKHTKVYNLGRSLAGLDIPVLHITDDQNWNTKQQQNERTSPATGSYRQKKNILITARIHPGQSNSSHMLFGFIHFLCSENKQAQQLRKIANFIIVPMVNPDGVVMGNSRSSAAGRDLNRQFIQPNRDLYPQDLAYKLQSKYGVIMYFDFHGHSRKKNTFFYGPAYGINEPDYYKCRILPKLIQKQNNAFRYHSCAFNITDQKKKTARASMFSQLKIPYTYTVQTSIGYYYDSERMNTYQFTRDSWIQIGQAISAGTSVFFVSLQQYEQFLKERRIQRLKKTKKQKGLITRSLKMNFLDQDDQISFPQKQEALRIFYNKTSLFSETMAEIKAVSKAQKETKNIDQPLSSDDHDQGQDLQLSTLKQFNNLVIQNAKKDQGLCTRKLFKEEIQIREQLQRKLNKAKSFVSPRDQQQMKLLQQIENSKQIIVEKEKPKTSASNRLRKNWKAQGKLKIIMQGANAIDQNKSANITFNPSHQQMPQDASKYLSLKSKRVSTSYGRTQQRKSAISRTNIMSEYPFPSQMNIHLPDSSVKKYQRTSIFRREQSKKQSRNHKTNDIQLISSSQHVCPPEKQLQIRPYSTRNTSSKPIQQKISYSSHFTAPEIKNPVEFKFDQIIDHFNNRSKIFGQPSIKNKRSKSKNSNIFPSSFFGIKQHSTKKRAFEPIIAVQNFQCFQIDPKSFTIKKIKK